MFKEGKEGEMGGQFSTGLRSSRSGQGFRGGSLVVAKGRGRGRIRGFRFSGSGDSFRGGDLIVEAM